MKKIQIQFTIGGGVFSHLLILITNIAINIRDGIIKADDILYVEGRRSKEKNGIFGVLPYNFFDLIFDQSLDDNFVTIENETSHPVLLEDINRDLLKYREASTLLKFHPDVIKETEQFYNEHINTSNILGIHIRMTDMNSTSLVRFSFNRRLLSGDR